MIKINVITNNINWLRYIKDPNNYLERKIKKINLKEKKFDKKSIFCTLLLSGNKEIKNPTLYLKCGTDLKLHFIF